MNDANPIKDIYQPDFLRRPKDLEQLLLQMLKGGLNKHARDQVGIAASQYVARTVGLDLMSPDNLQIDEPTRLLIKALQKIGYVYVPDVFDPADITSIKSYLAEKLMSCDVSGTGKFERHMKLSDVTPDISFGHYSVADVCRCEQIYRVIHDPRLIRMVARYLGAPPTIGIVSAWWSFPAAGPPAGMQQFHHDRGDFRSCNLFVYLTDVDEGSGPHAFVEGTHEISVLMPTAMKRYGQEPQKFNAFWQWMEQHRKSDEEVRGYFPENEIKFHTGRTGTSFLEDTRGLHKGTRPTTGRRLAFEIFYSIMPKMNEVISQIDRATLSFEGRVETRTEALDPMVRFATRQFYK